MTPNNQRQAGKYNAQKEWEDENKTGEPFVSADDSMAYVKKKNYAIMDKKETKQEPTEDVTATPQNVDPNDQPKEPEATPFQKVDYKKRYDDLKRHYDAKVNSFKQREKELQEQVRSAAPKYTPPKTEEELAKFREENPDLYGVVETVAHMRSSQQAQELEAELKEVRERLQVEEANRAYAELKVLVPDYEEIRQDDEFHAWAEQQPKEIQDWVYRNRTNVQLAAQAINLYKASKGMMGGNAPKPPRQNTQSDQRGTADQSVNVQARNQEPTSREKVWTSKEIAALSTQQYEHYRDEIDKAFAEGRVVRV